MHAQEMALLYPSRARVGKAIAVHRGVRADGTNMVTKPNGNDGNMSKRGVAEAVSRQHVKDGKPAWVYQATCCGSQRIVREEPKTFLNSRSGLIQFKDIGRLCKNECRPIPWDKLGDLTKQKLMDGRPAYERFEKSMYKFSHRLN